MRTVVLLLLLANLTLFGYTRLDSAGTGEAARLDEQVQPDKIKLLTPQQVAALGPAKVAALSDVCVEWGPFGAADLTKAMTDLEPLQLGRLLTQRRVDVDNAWWVSIGPFPSRPAAERRATELRAQNVGDVSVADTGRGQFNVSLGVFRTEQAAIARANTLIEQGIKTARAEPRQQSIAQSMLVVRDPQQPAMARLKDLVPQYPGSDIKVGACPAT